MEHKNNVIMWFKLKTNYVDILIYHNNHFKPIKIEGLRAKLKRWLGREEYDRIMETRIKHPHKRKYYEPTRTRSKGNSPS